MMRLSSSSVTTLACLVLLFVPIAAQAAPVASVQASSNALSLTPLVAHDGMMLRVSGPDGLTFEREFAAGTSLLLSELSDGVLADGVYTWELVLYPAIGNGVREQLRRARATGDEAAVEALRARGQLPAEALTESGSFRLNGGAIVRDDLAEDEDVAGSGIESGAQAAVAPSSPTALAEGDQVILDDLIVDGSACIGFDCVNGENFGFDTIRLKENNLRIKFEDTSGNNFPTNDWQLTANDSANGGLNKFSIDDIDGGRTPFTIEARAPSHSLYVDDGGRLGLGTSIPVVDLHVVSGNSPTLRLEQNGSSGFAPQTWDVVGNETNFFVRDASNGSQLPLRIRPGAPTNSLYIDPDGDVGLGTSSPDFSLDVEGSGGDTAIRVTETSAASMNRVLIQASNANGNVQTSFLPNGGAVTEWRQTFRVNDLIFDSQEDGANELVLETDGDMTIGGTLTENSDVANKKDIVPVDVDSVLAKVAALPISTWTYKQDDQGARHMGPMAQDFYGAFGLGATERGIAAVDRDGVALAAIQALYQQLQAKDEVLDTLKAQNDELLRRLEALENQTP